ncbi:MAG: DUF4159 domain-containing protein [Phycisphaerales bacterium]|jgi:hypothetical protein|nr:DUF4159 domain-containing protein [Phycisphaerales bacterium]
MRKLPEIVSCVLVSVILLGTGSAMGAGKKKAGPGFSDAAIKAAIQKGAAYLWSKQNDDGGWDAHGKPGGGHYYKTGPGAMAIYALLESGVSPQDKRMEKALRWLRSTPDPMAYSIGMRANAWEVANRTTNDKYKDILRDDTARVIDSSLDGSFEYSTAGSPKRNGDNSTSQFGLLAMWAASLNDITIRNSTWKLCMGHWMRTQTPEGGWAYRGNTATRDTMTAAGIASMYVCIDNLHTQTFVKRPARVKDFKELQTVQKAVDLLDKSFKGIKGSGLGAGGYYMYGIERVGLACGYKYFNGKDWYKEGAIGLLKGQAGAGNWGATYQTAFCMLFLIRGQHPVLFNKLKYNGAWNNRPRELASLTRWMSKKYENTFNWQIVDLKMPIGDWHDAPILVITGSQEPKFSEAEISKMRNFVLQGGTILSITEANFGGGPFNEGMRKIYDQMLPEYKLALLPKNHELYDKKVYYALPGERLKLEVASNGIRPMVIHTGVDVAARWQAAVSTTTDARPHFEAATNIARYVTGQLLNLRHRGVSHWPAKTNRATTKTIRVARLKHSGDWNPEPMADKALKLKMKNRAGIKLEIGDAIGITDLPASGLKLAMLTGTKAVTFESDEIAAMKTFVEGGGTILIDVAGGTGGKFGEVKPFARSVTTTLKEMFPGRRNKLRRLAVTSPLYAIDGNTINTVKYRMHTFLRVSDKSPQLGAIMVNRRPGILYSEMDLTAGLVGYSSLAVDGYTPDSAFKIVRNVILYTDSPE